MTQGKFKHIDIKLVEPPFESELTDFIIGLEHLRKRQLSGTTHPSTFFQLKRIFHMLESLGSARIEGNRTTLAEFIETIIDEQKTQTEAIVEIQNMDETLSFIDEVINHTPINRAFLSELHKRVVKNLSVEGSANPGEWRRKQVRITGSRHTPPDAVLVADYMDELISFINRRDAAKYDLLKTAISHHRFAWVHPFDNGNGRTVRLLTYAMLVKQGFNVNVGHIINPTAVFCHNRKAYYLKLEEADSGTDSSQLQWCEYVLGGLRQEIDKIDRLLDFSYLSRNILAPTIRIALDRKWVTPQEADILKIAVEKQVFKAGDIKHLFPKRLPPAVSRIIHSLVTKKMIRHEKPGTRKYVLSFENNYLLRGIIELLDKEGFLPIPMNR